MDLTGKKFGRLTVLELHSTKNYQKKYRCRCDCGNEVVVFGANLTRNHTTSCGCVKAAVIAAGAHTIHGGRQSRLYNIWKEMRRRCNNPNRDNYERYGGRGIAVCEEWDSFETFREWAIGAGYKDNLTIDRIDNEKGYSPNNCRWSDNRTQSNNRRSNRFLTHDGKTMTIAEWSRETGIPQSTIQQRISKSGWSIEKALTTPPRGKIMPSLDNIEVRALSDRREVHAHEKR